MKQAYTDYNDKLPGTIWASRVAGQDAECRITHIDDSTYVFRLCVAEVISGPHTGAKIAKPSGDFFCVSLMARAA
jgi:hypothetical protein